MDQAASAHQVLLGQQRERRENTNLGRCRRLCLGRDCETRTQGRTKPQRNFANPEHHVIRENTAFAGSKHVATN